MQARRTGNGWRGGRRSTDESGVASRFNLLFKMPPRHWAPLARPSKMQASLPGRQTDRASRWLPRRRPASAHAAAQRAGADVATTVFRMHGTGTSVTKDSGIPTRT